VLPSSGVSVAAWNAYDEGYLRAHVWADALAGGAEMPREATATSLGPGEVAHAHFAPVDMAGYFGENKEYRSSFLLFGGPIGLAVTGAASMAYNAKKKADAQRAAVPRWHRLGKVDLVVTSQRLVLTRQGQAQSFWYAETGPLRMASGRGGIPAVQLQPSGAPVLQLDFAWAPVLYVFVHHLVDGRPPDLPLPAGLLERAKAEGRLR
jgi:hypothetical protein